MVAARTTIAVVAQATTVKREWENRILKKV